MDGLAHSLGTKRTFVIPNSFSYLCPDWNQFRYDDCSFPPEPDDIKVGPLELVTWTD